MLEKTLESPLDCKIQLVSPKGNQSWIFTGKTDAEAEDPIFWSPDSKIWLTGKDPDAGKGWRQEEKGMTGDEMVEWNHWLNGHEFEHALGDGDRQRILACCSPWGCKESDTFEWLNWTDSLYSNLVSDICMIYLFHPFGFKSIKNIIKSYVDSIYFSFYPICQFLPLIV